MPDEMVEPARSNGPVTRMRRVSLTVDIEIPESEFADLAAKALETGGDLRSMLAARYLVRPGDRAAASSRAGAAPPYRVGDFRHLYGKAPSGAAPYRGIGRPPAWLHALITEELAGR